MVAPSDSNAAVSSFDVSTTKASSSGKAPNKCSIVKCQQYKLLNCAYCHNHATLDSNSPFRKCSHFIETKEFGRSLDPDCSSSGNDDLGATGRVMQIKSAAGIASASTTFELMPKANISGKSPNKCSYMKCQQYKVLNSTFCHNHATEDTDSPFKKCDYDIERNDGNKRQCTNSTLKSETFCSHHSEEKTSKNVQ